MSPRSLGVEEEFLLVEPGTGRPQAVAGTILRAARPELEGELQEQQLETNSRPCRTLDELHRELRRCRASATQEAERVGAHVVALATSPVPVEPSPLRSERYERMAEDYGLTAQEQLTCGCHVHPGWPGRWWRPRPGPGGTGSRPRGPGPSCWWTWWPAATAPLSSARSTAGPAACPR